MKAKALIYKDKPDLFVYVMDGMEFESSLPQLRPEECTMEGLQNYYHSIKWDIDFSIMELKTLEIRIVS